MKKLQRVWSQSKPWQRSQGIDGEKMRLRKHKERRDSVHICSDALLLSEALHRLILCVVGGSSHEQKGRQSCWSGLLRTHNLCVCLCICIQTEFAGRNLLEVERKRGNVHCTHSRSKGWLNKWINQCQGDPVAVIHNLRLQFVRVWNTRHTFVTKQLSLELNQGCALYRFQERLPQGC